MSGTWLGMYRAGAEAIWRTDSSGGGRVYADAKTYQLVKEPSGRLIIGVSS